MGALAGRLVGGAVGGLVGALVGMGIRDAAKRYEGRLKEGGVLLSVHCDTSDDITRQEDLKTTGADGHRLGEAKRVGAASAG